MFLARRSRVEELCRALVQNRLNRMYKWTCSARASSVDENILRQMRKAGCIYIIYGFESGSQRMLDAMNKKTTVEQNYRAVVLTKKAGILINSAFIVNLPGEEEPDILATIEFIKRTKVYTANLNNLMPLPGSAYYREFLDRGIVTHSETLWDEIGVLPESFENIRLYNDISSDRFVQLCEEAKSIIWDINIRNYIRVNWYRDPRYCLENAISLIGRFFAGKKGTATYLVAQRLYRSMKGTLKKVLKEVRNRWRREQG